MDNNLTVVEKRLKFLREIKKLTQTELADKLNVSQALINSWENGYQNVALKQLIKISYFYQVPVDYILGLITEFNKFDYNFKNVLDLELLGERIRLIRKMEDLTLKEFANKIKTNFINISCYERAQKTISSADLKDICNTFGFSADWCIGNIDECIRRSPNINIKREDIRKYINV